VAIVWAVLPIEVTSAENISDIFAVVVIYVPLGVFHLKFLIVTHKIGAIVELVESFCRVLGLGRHHHPYWVRRVADVRVVQVVVRGRGHEEAVVWIAAYVHLGGLHWV